MTRNHSIVFRIAFIVILFISLTLGGLISADICSARAENINYKRKIVSVLFDNSFSMRNSGGAGKGEDRTELAKYSLEMLVTLLGENDELYLTTMNEAHGSNGSTFQIDLKSDDRLSEMEEKIVNNSALYPIGSTPASSIGKALSVLTDRGLASSNDPSYNENTDTEYWLVMLTDGIFDEGDTESIIEDYIKNYNGLNSIYLAFGSGAKDLTNPDLPLNQNYPFSAYYIPNPQLLIEAMRDIANKISGRYGAETGGNQYTVSGKEVIVNLDNIKFAVNNIAVVVQDCGATLSNATYGGKNLMVTQKCGLKGSFINSDGAAVQIVRDGYVSVVSDGEYMSGGQVKFVYDKEVGDKVFVLVEPAIYIDAYLEREKETGWVKTDLQEINSTMRPGDEVRVQYKVYSSATDEEISLSEIFGTPTQKVTYCGKGYDVGEPISLEKGNNAISVSIAVLSGSYTMYSNINCCIEENPTYYRLEADLKEQIEEKKTTIVYTLFSDNQPVDRDGLSDYNVEIAIRYPDGKEYETVFDSVSEDGKMSFCLDSSKLEFGQYVITAKATKKETNISRTNVQTITSIPKEFHVECVTTDKINTTLYRLENHDYQVKFAVTVDGQPVAFSNPVINYKLTLDNEEVTEKGVEENGNLVFYISKNNLPNLSVGVKTLKLEADVLGKVFDSASYEFEISNSVYAVEVLDIGTRELDLYHLRDTEAAVYFKVYRDGMLLSTEEINAAMESGEIAIETNPFGWLTLLPCEVDTSVEQTEDGGTMIACRVKDDMAKPFDSLFSSFVFAKEKNISLTYNGITGSDTISINNLSMAGRIWRWCVLLAILLFIIHVITYIMGFFVAKPLPKGTLLVFSLGTNMESQVGSPFALPINMSRHEIVLWHISRFIPFREFKNQRPRFFGEAEISINKKTKEPEIQFNKNVVEYRFSPSNNNAGRAVREILDACSENQPYEDLEITTQSFSRFLRRSSREIIESGTPQNLYGCYGTVDVGVEDTHSAIKPDEIYYFVSYRDE